MPAHSEQRLLPFSADQLHAMVLDVESYPHFLPWCLGARIRERSEDHIKADLLVGYKVFREKFTSHVDFSFPNAIEVSYIEGPFQYLKNRWHFDPMTENSCVVNFYVDFEFKNPLFQSAMGVVFGQAVTKMISAFETRAHQLYCHA